MAHSELAERLGIVAERDGDLQWLVLRCEAALTICKPSVTSSWSAFSHFSQLVSVASSPAWVDNPDDAQPLLRNGWCRAMSVAEFEPKTPQELPIRKREVVLVNLDEQAPEGWLLAARDADTSKQGLVPASFVIPADIAVVAEQGFTGRTEDELSFNAGDVLIVRPGALPARGWWLAKRERKRGFVPRYVLDPTWRTRGQLAVSLIWARYRQHCARKEEGAYPYPSLSFEAAPVAKRAGSVRAQAQHLLECVRSIEASSASSALGDVLQQQWLSGTQTQSHWDTDRLLKENPSTEKLPSQQIGASSALPHTPDPVIPQRPPTHLAAVVRARLMRETASSRLKRHQAQGGKLLVRGGSDDSAEQQRKLSASESAEMLARLMSDTASSSMRRRHSEEGPRSYPHYMHATLKEDEGLYNKTSSVFGFMRDERRGRRHAMAVLPPADSPGSSMQWGDRSEDEDEDQIVQHWSRVRESMVPKRMTSSVSLPALLRRSSAQEVSEDELELDELCASALNPDVEVFHEIRKADNQDIARKNRTRDRKAREIETFRDEVKMRYDDAVSEEQEMRRHLMDLQRQLRRARNQAAQQMRVRQRQEKARLLRADMDERTRLNVSLQLREVAPASDVEVHELSKLFNLRMSMLPEPDSRGSDPKRGGRWYRMFKNLDSDGNGQISFEEFVHFIRRPESGLLPGLGLGPKVLPDAILFAVWRVMDLDASGMVTPGEFGKFMRLGALPVQPQERLLWMHRAREERRQKVQAEEQEHVEEAVRMVSENTRRMKAEAERIQRALRNPEQLLGSKEPIRDGRVGYRFNGSNFADGGYYGGLPPAGRIVAKIGSQRSPPRRLQPMKHSPSTPLTKLCHNEDDYGFCD